MGKGSTRRGGRNDIPRVAARPQDRRICVTNENTAVLRTRRDAGFCFSLLAFVPPCLSPSPSLSPISTVICWPMNPAVTETNLPFPVRRGKVRDVYDLGPALLIVAT